MNRVLTLVMVCSGLASNSVAFAQATNGASPSIYKKTAAPPHPDYSVMPIACDEPIKPFGFPPLPDRLDLATLPNAGVASRGVDATAPGRSLHYSNGQPKPTGLHQGYQHCDPAAFIPQNAMRQRYKVTPPGTDYYNNNSQAGQNQPPHFASAAANALKNMGPQPRLLPDQPQQAAAPVAITVNQATTQDLSMPDDQFASGQASSRSTTGSRVSQRAGQMIGRTVYQTFNQASGTAASMGSMLMRFR